MERIVKLLFKGPVHFGEGRLSGGGYTCDAATLFSALFIESLRMGVADDLLEAAKQGELSVSDTFPFMGERLYVPKPMTPVVRRDDGQRSEQDSRARKASKKLKYVPIEQLAEYVRGDFDPVKESERFDLGKSFSHAKVNLTRGTSDDAEPYHVGGFAFNPDCGIYFVCRGSYDLIPLLEQLQFSGLGGKRTSGYGAFKFDIVDARGRFDRKMENGGATGKMLLSSSIPRVDELTDELLSGARYRVVRKGGFVQSDTHASSPRKKRDMWAFVPGSVFSREFSGDVLDVNCTPGAHPVYRYARAMWMEV